MGKSTYEPLLPNWAERAMQRIDPRRAALAQNAEAPPDTPPQVARSLLLLTSTVASAQGNHAAAADAAEQLSELASGDAEALFDTARCFALCAEALVREAADASVEVEQPLGREYQRRALDALQRATERGLRDWQRMETDPDLESLRQLPEYRALIEGLKGNRTMDRE
jgi:hypothetical protein